MRPVLARPKSAAAFVEVVVVKSSAVTVFTETGMRMTGTRVQDDGVKLTFVTKFVFRSTGNFSPPAIGQLESVAVPACLALYSTISLPPPRSMSPENGAAIVLVTSALATPATNIASTARRKLSVLPPPRDIFIIFVIFVFSLNCRLKSRQNNFIKVQYAIASQYAKGVRPCHFCKLRSPVQTCVYLFKLAFSFADGFPPVPDR